MASYFRVVYKVASNAATVKGKLRLNAGNGGVSAAGQTQSLASYTEALACGAYNGNIRIATTAVQASGTVTFISLANNDTVTVNGRVYTAKTSGATGLQQFNLGASDAAAALNFQAAVNADTSALIKNVVTASSSSSGVSSITCLIPGNIGNMCTLAISAHGSVSAANLASGAEDTNVILPNGL